VTAHFSARPRRRRADASLAALDRIAQFILDGRDADEVLDAIAREALDLVVASGVTIGMPTADGTGIVLRAGAGQLAANLGPGGIVRGSIVPIDGTVMGHAIRDGHAIVSRDASQEAAAYLVDAAKRAGLGPVIAIPLTIRNRIFGGLAVARASGNPPFSRAEIQVVRTFAAQASVAVELSQVRDELRQLAVVQERERIAREMHDGVIQTLFGLGMSLQGLATSTALPTGVGERLNVVVDGIDAVIRDLRNYIFGLRPGLLADRELEGALRRLASDLAASANVLVQVEIDPVTAALLSPVAAEVVQIAREALSNIRRHAGASTARVVLSHSEARAVLQITDDGVGLDADAQRGQGLDNMHSRAARLGGELLLGPGAEAHGTTVTLAIPL
jgi:signal transduction histidine kinase